MSSGKTSGNRALPALYWLKQTYQASRTQILDGFKKSGLELTPEQWSLLVELWQTDRLTPSQLAERTGRTRPGVSRLLDTMSRQGWIRRISSDEDRRACYVCLTDDGRSLHDQLLPIYSQVTSQAMQGLTKREQEQLTSLLRKVFLNLQVQDED